MSKHESEPCPPAMPSIQFIYGSGGEAVGETAPLTGPIVEAFMDGDITAKQYFRQCRAQEAANRRLRDFMYGDKPPDFMPKIRRMPRWRGVLSHILKAM